MKLYHGTTIENATSIVANGFKLSSNDDSRCDRDYAEPCIYGFNNYADAEDFILNQGQNTQAVISFDVPEECCFRDEEYDDSAYIITILPESAELIWTQEV